MWVVLRKGAKPPPTIGGEDAVDDGEDPDPDVERFRPHGLKTTPTMSLAGLSTVARVVSVHDGDTLTVVLPAFGGYYRFHVRLDGIDACELGAERPANRMLAKMARDRLVQLVAPPLVPPLVPPLAPPLAQAVPDTQAALEQELERVICIVTLRCGRFDKYGRVLGSVYEDARSVNQVLLDEKLAYAYHGGRRLTEDEQMRAMGRDPDGEISTVGNNSKGIMAFWKRVVGGVPPRTPSQNDLADIMCAAAL